MDPMIKLWVYESWISDQEEKHRFAKDYSVLIGSFTNPEAAQQMMKDENPDVALSEEEFEESTQKVLEEREEENKAKQVGRRQRRRMRVIKDN